MSKSIQVYLVVFSTILGFLLVLGCGPSAEKEKMMAFMQDYQKTLDEYKDANSKGDNDKKVELKAKLDSLKDQWTHLKDEIGSEVTPQTMEKFDSEFKELSKKYAELSGKP
jgi:outer membrane murein-binding lipoprotein Lpp